MTPSRNIPQLATPSLPNSPSSSPGCPPHPGPRLITPAPPPTTTPHDTMSSYSLAIKLFLIPTPSTSLEKFQTLPSFTDDPGPISGLILTEHISKHGKNLPAHWEFVDDEVILFPKSQTYGVPVKTGELGSFNIEECVSVEVWVRDISGRK